METVRGKILHFAILGEQSVLLSNNLNQYKIKIIISIGLKYAYLQLGRVNIWTLVLNELAHISAK